MMRKELMRQTGLVALALAMAMAGCAAHNPLEPAAAADRVAGLEDAAVEEVDGARVVAQVGQWPGTETILDDVTPVRIEITNDSDKPLRVRYSDYALVATDGTRYAALPPVATDGTAQLPTMYRPGGPYPGFVAAPYYAGVGPHWNTTTLGTGIHPAPGYYDHYYNYWTTVSLPTPQMLERALPEGVLAPGSRVDGFVYFERVRGDAHRRLYLTADLVNHETGELFGEVRIPFDTKQ